MKYNCSDKEVESCNGKVLYTKYAFFKSCRKEILFYKPYFQTLINLYDMLNESHYTWDAHARLAAIAIWAGRPSLSMVLHIVPTFMYYSAGTRMQSFWSIKLDCENAFQFIFFV